MVDFRSCRETITKSCLQFTLVLVLYILIVPFLGECLYFKESSLKAYFCCLTFEAEDSLTENNFIIWYNRGPVKQYLVIIMG